jgi:hypothetical protein
MTGNAILSTKDDLSNQTSYAFHFGQDFGDVQDGEGIRVASRSEISRIPTHLPSIANDLSNLFIQYFAESSMGVHEITNIVYIFKHWLKRSEQNWFETVDPEYIVKKRGGTIVQVALLEDE